VFCIHTHTYIRFDNSHLFSKGKIIASRGSQLRERRRRRFYAVCGGQRGATQCRFSSPCERRARRVHTPREAAAAASERESMHYVWRDRFSAVETAAQRDDGERVRSRSLSCTAPFARLGSPAVSRSLLCLLGTLLQPTLLLLVPAGPFSFWPRSLFSASPKTPEILPWLLT
jgi:hypothetical protein